MRIPKLAVALIVGCIAVHAAADAAFGARTAARRGGVQLDAPAQLAGSDTSLVCFDGLLTLLLNPGCFDANDVCGSHTGHYFIQYLTPNFATPHRVKRIAFVSNDQSTVFPRAGVVLIPVSENRFPTMAELAALPVQNVPTPQDTSIVYVDLPLEPPLVVTSNTDVVVCLAFPEGGTLSGIGVGPGILVDEDAPDQRCDYLTLDGGAEWLENDFGNDPLDWGFEVQFEPYTAVEPRTWSEIKRLFGAPVPALLHHQP
jgi:hypothetical protein